MSWYKKSSDEESNRSGYTFSGIRFLGEASGKYIPATQNEVAQFPTIELTDAEIENVKDMEEYIDRISDVFDPMVIRVIKEREQHFGHIEEPIIFNLYGIRYTVKVPGMYPGNWVIVDATMIDSNEFLKHLPERIEEDVKNAMLGEE